ncbi:MAG: NINE protein [Vicinamibacterales bacterium]|nr:NINE protein [Vicinamibacterales bacterium]
MTGSVTYGRDASRRETAAFLAFVLGGIGAHKFYLGRTAQGVLCVVLFWSFIPALIAVGEGLFYLSLSDEAFEQASASRHGLLRQMLNDAAMVVAVLLVPRDQFIVTARDPG